MCNQCDTSFNFTRILWPDNQIGRHHHLGKKKMTLLLCLIYLGKKGDLKKVHWTNFWTNIEFCPYYPEFWGLFWQYSQYVTLMYIRRVFKDIIEYENCTETPFINLNDDASWFISNYLQMSIIFEIFILLWACFKVYVYFW